MFLTTRLGHPVKVRLQATDEGGPLEGSDEEPAGRAGTAARRQRSPANEKIVGEAVELFEGTIEEGYA